MTLWTLLALLCAQEEKGRILVLLDDSESMGRVDPLGPDEAAGLEKLTGAPRGELRKMSRLERARKALAAVLPEWRKKGEVWIGTFTGKPSPDGTALESWTASASRSEFRLPDLERVVAVVVVSDFRIAGGLEAAQGCARRFLPMWTILPARPPPDVFLREPELPETALAGDTVRLRARIESRGLDGREATLGLFILERTSPSATAEELLKDARPDLTSTVRLADAGREFDMNVGCRRPGDYFVVVEVSPFEEEADRENNRIVLPLRVSDDTIRVLFVETVPRYEYRFLKTALLRDPKILCHTLLLSADADFPQEFTRGAKDPDFQAPLKEFPRTFKELSRYDALIFGDVAPKRLGAREDFDRIEKFVSEWGGGLVLVSGKSNPRLYLEQETLAKLVPVTEVGAAAEDANVTYGFALTEEGKGHPIPAYEKFGGSREKNAEHWEKGGQVGVRWFLPATKLKVTATPLVDLVDAKKETRHPLFVVQHYGRGRVFWSATDETWLWRYQSGDAPWYYPFWKRVLSWVRQGRLPQARFRVQGPPPVCRLGEKVRVRVRWLETPAVPEIPAVLETPRGDRRDLKIRDPWTLEFTPDEAGRHRLTVGEGEEARSFEFSVVIPRAEDDASLDPGTWRAMAERSHRSKKDRPQQFTLDGLGELSGDLPEVLFRKP
jgi:hypothetical protein